MYLYAAPERYSCGTRREPRLDAGRAGVLMEARPPMAYDRRDA